jgi:DNA-binding GntR family transcriptional regulator
MSGWVKTVKYPNLYSQPQEVIDRFEDKAYSMLVSRGIIKLVDGKADNYADNYVDAELIADMAQELFDISQNGHQHSYGYQK